MSNRRRLDTLTHDTGQTLAEYSILVGSIAIVVAVAVPFVGARISGLLTAALTALGG